MTHLGALAKRLKRFQTLIFSMESLWIGAMILAFWHISPPIRDRYVFLLLFLIPLYTIRFFIHQRIFTRTPLDVLFLIFIIATVYNFHNAPLARADYWVLVCRPLLGILMVWHFVEHVRIHQHMRYLIVASVCITSLIGLVALVASQWTVSAKSDDLSFIIDFLPKLDNKQILPDMQLSFNPNEIAGALAYCCPFLLGVTLMSFRNLKEPAVRFEPIVRWIETWGALIGFLITFTALFLGQSRFALAGSLVGMFFVLLVALPNWRLRGIGVAIWGVIVIVEAMLVLNILPLNFAPNPEADIASASTEQSAGLSQRDTSSFNNRFDLWDRAIQMTLDYPTTGAGMSVYRAMVAREEYEIPSYVARGTVPPHAHNAFFQMGADFGVIGWFLFIGWYGVVAGMAIYTFRNKNLNFKIMTIAICASILGYMGYGIGDTITLWDRFAFVHWWFIGLMTALYYFAKHSPHITKLNN